MKNWKKAAGLYAAYRVGRSHGRGGTRPATGRSRPGGIGCGCLTLLIIAGLAFGLWLGYMTR